jgi:hypothetical protein
MLSPLFVGDGLRDTTGAAEATAAAETAAEVAAVPGAAIFYAPALSPADLDRVRTRGDLADLINSAADPVLVKQEEAESNWTGGERMDLVEEEGDVEFIGEFDGDEHSVYYSDDGDEEEDESLLEEQEYEEQDGAGEEEQGEAMEHEAVGEGRGQLQKPAKMTPHMQQQNRGFSRWENSRRKVGTPAAASRRAAMLSAVSRRAAMPAAVSRRAAMPAEGRISRVGRKGEATSLPLTLRKTRP